MIINAQSVKKGGGRESYSVGVSFLDKYGELVRPSLHTPEGTVRFAWKNADPADFTKVDWIESTGMQSITTPYVPNNNTSMVFNFTTKGVPDVVDTATFFTAKPNWASASYSFYYRKNTGKFTYHGNENQLSNYLANTNYVLTYSRSSSSAILTNLDAGTSASAVVSADSGLSHLILFGWGSTDRGGIFRFKDMTLTELGANVAKYLPVFETETGLIGLFDAVNNLFLMNTTETAFVIPTDTSNFVNLAEYLAA